MVDFANTPALADAEVVLYDLDPASLPPALKVAEHVAERRGIPLTRPRHHRHRRRAVRAPSS